MRETPTVPVWGGCGVPCAQVGVLLVSPPHKFLPWDPELWAARFSGVGAERCDLKCPAQTRAPSRPLQAGTRERGHARSLHHSPLALTRAGGRQASRDAYRGLGFCGLGLLQSCFAGIQVKTPVLEEPPLLLQVENRKQ